VQVGYGSPEVLSLRQLDAPEPVAGEVLVRVRASSVNARDWHILRGDPYLARLALPAVFGLLGPKHMVRGSDVAGTVEAVGDGVTEFSVGHEVYGDASPGDGAFADYVCVPAAALEHKPGTLTFEQAAGVPLAGGTALRGLRDVAGVRAGQHVLVNGASGGVGTFAVQIAKALGAEVTGVCSARNTDLVLSAGADHVIDYAREDFARGNTRYDVVYDLAASRSLTDLRRAATREGTVVLSGGGPAGARRPRVVGPMGLVLRGALLGRFASQRVILPGDAPPSRAQLADLRELLDAGRIAPVIDRTYALDDVPAAVRYMLHEHARAKVVVSV